MKIAVIILGILGALAVGALGGKWVADYQDNKAAVAAIAKLAQSVGSARGDELDTALRGVERTKTAGYLMIVGALLALAAAISVGRFGKISALVLLASAIVPAALAPASLLAGFRLLIAGGLARFVKPRPAEGRPAVAARLAA